MVSLLGAWCAGGCGCVATRVWKLQDNLGWLFLKGKLKGSWESRLDGALLGQKTRRNVLLKQTQVKD